MHNIVSLLDSLIAIARERMKKSSKLRDFWFSIVYRAFGLSGRESLSKVRGERSRAERARRKANAKNISRPMPSDFNYAKKKDISSGLWFPRRPHDLPENALGLSLLPRILLLIETTNPTRPGCGMINSPAPMT
jgi:hypothetical protein